MSIVTFYFSRLIGSRVTFETQKAVGKLQDLIVDISSIRPQVVGLKVKFGHEPFIIDFSHVTIEKIKANYSIKCHKILEPSFEGKQILYVARHVLDKQVVDIEGRKVVRVNDLRLASLSTGLYVIAVDVGIEGLLRRLSIDEPLEKVLNIFGKTVPSNLILWDDVATVSASNEALKLSKSLEKLSTLHPSDLADILEDLDHNIQAEVFASLDEENAADVLEELEPDAQQSILESLPVEKAADVLEKMPADEAADILDDLDEEMAEELLSEMENTASKEIRELMEYPEECVGSLMTRDFVCFNESLSIDETITELRRLKPASDSIYYLYVVDDNNRLVASLSLRDLVTAEPKTLLREIMNTKVIKVEDYDRIDSLTETLTKYNLIAIPVVNENQMLVGMVIIDDIVTSLLTSRRKAILHAD